MAAAAEGTEAVPNGKKNAAGGKSKILMIVLPLLLLVGGGAGARDSGRHGGHNRDRLGRWPALRGPAQSPRSRGARLPFSDVAAARAGNRSLRSLLDLSDD